MGTQLKFLLILAAIFYLESVNAKEALEVSFKKLEKSTSNDKDQHNLKRKEKLAKLTKPNPLEGNVNPGEIDKQIAMESMNKKARNFRAGPQGANIDLSNIFISDNDFYGGFLSSYNPAAPPPASTRYFQPTSIGFGFKEPTRYYGGPMYGYGQNGMPGSYYTQPPSNPYGSYNRPGCGVGVGVRFG